jgi:NADP-dependent 3-hydroxy acid dehydrogenase YdfG
MRFKGKVAVVNGASADIGAAAAPAFAREGAAVALAARGAAALEKLAAENGNGKWREGLGVGERTFAPTNPQPLAPRTEVSWHARR